MDIRRLLPALALALIGCETNGAPPPAKERSVVAPAPGPAPSGAPERYKVPIGDSPARGGAAPKVTIVAFSEFQCPFCANVVPTLDALLKTYGEDVRLVFKHRPLPFHERAAGAALAAEAAGEQGRFWEMHDELFLHQKALAAPDMEGYARSLNFDLGRWKAALDGARAKARLEADQKLADDLAVAGTPSFFLNGRPLVGAQPIARFKALIDEELKLADEKLAAGVPRAALYGELTKNGLERATRPAARNRPTGAPTPAPEQVMRVDLGASPVRGPADALVTIVVFSDFQCPFCARVEPTLARVLEEYKGKVRIVWKDLALPFHDLALPAAIAAREARQQGKFWEMHAKLFANQGALDRASLEKYGADLGLNPGRLKAALDGQLWKADVEADAALAARLGIRGTPSFFINGRVFVGARPFEQFKERIDEELARAESLVAAGVPRTRVYEKLMSTALAALPPEEATVR
jgi:protein-disulfide isomerase